MSRNTHRHRRSVLTGLLLILLTAALSGCAPRKNQSESTPADAIEPASEYAAATRDPIATEVARDVLAAGGNAADAAFAVGAAISVSEPHFSHALGGGTWALYYNAADNAVRALDGVGRSGSLVDPGFFRDPARNTPFGTHRVVVPGAWDAWMLLLRDEGSMDLDSLLEPAIAMAAGGVPASRSMVGFILQEESRIRQFPHSAAIFLPDGTPPQVGEPIIQENLAATLRELAHAYREAYERSSEVSREQRRRAGIQAAREYYYRGPIARDLSRFILSTGGFVQERDFARFAAAWREPLHTSYKDTVVYSPPPNSQGISMLLALNILEHLELSPDAEDPLNIHRIIEATKLAKIDTWHYVADPLSMPVSARELLDKGYAARQAQRIQDDAVITWPREGGLHLSEQNNTTTFSVVDADGNAAAVTTSTGAQFLVGGDTGILLNQRMAVMEITRENPNSIAPDKKPRHTVKPYMAFRNGRFLIAGGNTGFDTQPQGQIQQFINLIEFGMSPQEAVSQRRYITHAFPASHHPHAASNELFLEPGTPARIREDLQRRGHDVGRSGIIGNAVMLYRNPATGTLEFGADPRGENSGFTADRYRPQRGHEASGRESR